MSKIVLVTGASSGFGRAIAQRLAEQGHTVFGTSRNPFGNLGKIRMIALDVTDDSSVINTIGDIVAITGRIDVLINNAGVGICGAVEDTGMDEVRRQMEINFFGAVRTIRAVIPHMRAQGEGRIINISSLAGLISLPFQAYYSASKFALEAINEALRMELSGSGIDSTNINPGGFRTGFTASRMFTRQAFAGRNSTQLTTTVALYERDELSGANPDMVAKLVTRLVLKRRVNVRYSVGRFDQRMMALVKRAIPAWVFERILKGAYSIK